MANTQKNPFVGLRPFESEDSLYFFGRNEQTKALLKLLHETHFLAVVGSSGCGKSSLVRAGLIPHLEAGFLVQDRDVWHIARMKPGDQPMINLAQALLTALKQEAAPAKVTEFAASLQEQGVHAALDQIVPVLTTTDSNLLLLVDQFEEIFRFSMNPQAPEKRDEAVEFVATLLRLAEQADTPIYVCLTMRSDYLGDCDQFQGLPEAMNRSQYLVPRLTRAQRREAIVGPIQLAGATISPPLLDRLLNETIEERDDLPVLQHALMLTWNEWAKTDTGAIEMGHYEQIGTIHHALSRHADEALNELSQRDQFLAQQLFQALTETDASNRQIRRPTHLNDLAAIAETSPEKMLTIIQQFRKDERNFLVLSSPNAADNPLVDISHESLIRQWEKLNEWVNKEAESAKIYRRLAESAELYAQGRAGLYRKADLDLALFWRVLQHPNQAWARRYHPGFATAIDFLTKGVKAHNDEIGEKEKQQKEREQLLQDKAKLMEEQNLQQRKTIRQTRWFSAVLGVAFLMAILAFLWAYQMRNEARKQEMVALYNEIKAKLESEHSLNSSKEAQLQKSLALKEKAKADSTAFYAEEQKNNALSEKTKAENSAKIAKEQKEIAVEAKNKADRQRLLANYNMAKFFEVKAKNTLDSARQLKDNQKYQLVLLYSAAALEQEIEPDSFALIKNSIHNLFSMDVFQNSLALKWISSMQNDLINSIAISPDGKIIASASNDRTILLWDIITGRELDTLKGHTDNVINVKFSPDGLYLASGSKDKTVRIWDMKTRNETQILNEHQESINSVAFSSDGYRLASGSSDRTIRLWDITTGRELRVFSGHRGIVNCVTFSPDGKLLASASFDNTIRLWEVKTGHERCKLHKHTADVNCITFSSDGQKIASGSDDHTIRIWDIAAAQEIKIIEEEHASINCVSFSPDGQKLASGSNKQAISIWDIVSGEKKRILKGHKGSIKSIAFTPDGNTLISASEDKTIGLWDVVSNDEWSTFHNVGMVNSLAFSPDDQILASASSDQTIQLWKVATRRKQSILKGHNKEVKSIAFSPDGKILASGSSDNSIRLWEISTGNELHLLKGHIASVNSVVFSTNGQLLASGSSDHTIRLWEISTGNEIRKFNGNAGAIWSLAFSPNEQWLASSGSLDGDIRLWNIITGHELCTFHGHNKTVTTLAFSPNGEMLVSGSFDNTVRLWQIANDQEKLILKGHENPVLSVAFSPDGQMIASGSSDKTIRLWDLNTGYEQYILQGHDGDIKSLIFSSNGQILASGSSDHTIRLWDLRPYRLFFADKKPTPIFFTFYEGVQFFWKVKQTGLNFQYERISNFPYDPKFNLLRNPPALGKNKFDQVIEWSIEQNKSGL